MYEAKVKVKVNVTELLTLSRLLMDPTVFVPNLSPVFEFDNCVITSVLVMH